MLENIKNEFEKIKFPQLSLRKNDTLPEDNEVTEIEPYDREVHGEIVDLEMFLFSWDEIPGNDEEKLREFLTGCPKTKRMCTNQMMFIPFMTII